MARKQEVYTARFKRAAAPASVQAEKLAGKKESASKSAEPKTAAKKLTERKTTEKKAVEKKTVGKTPVEKKAAEKKTADKTAEKKTAEKKTAAGRKSAPKEPVIRAKTERVQKVSAAKKPADKAAANRGRRANAAEPAVQETPVRRRRSQELTRREARERERMRIAANERKQALSRSGGFAVTLITLLTVAFDVLGLLLCAVRGSAVDTQALGLIVLMASLALLTALVLPRYMGIDPLLMALTNFLCGVSVVILYTVVPERGLKQAVFYAAGVLVMLAMSAVVSHLRKWRGMAGFAMAVGIAALILPLAFGQWNYGAKNWVQLPVIGSFQPSEFVKLSLVLALAYSFSAHRTVWQMMPALVFAAACLVLLMLQRDLGTALIYYITTLVMFYAACGNVPLTLVGLGGGVGAAVLGYRMFAHVKVRVAMWRNPWSDALDKGYQIIQALLAIGSGGLFGVGLGQGTPEKIPAYWNDFIFAVICEQLGMVFGICVILVYALLIVRAVSVCMRSRRSFDLLLGCGVAALLGTQTFMIIAGVIKMLPLTGVTMPFMSYGGSSLISCMAMLGILHGIYARAQDELEDDMIG